MITVVNDPKLGKTRVITQQYESGLYVALYREGKAIPVQFGTTEKEISYHKKLRKKFPWIVEESSELPEKKGKVKI